MIAGKKWRMGLVLAALVVSASACTGPSEPSSQLTAPSSTPTPDIAPLPPSGTATDLPLAASEADKEKLMQALTALLSFNQKPSTNDIRQYLIGEGVKTENLQITKTKTPTGLDVDAIEIGWASGDKCIMGYIHETQASVSVLPILPDDTCFIGVSYE